MKRRSVHVFTVSRRTDDMTDESSDASSAAPDTAAPAEAPAVKPFHWINDQGDSLVSSKV
jgi:hypothetical protein